MKKTIIRTAQPTDAVALYEATIPMLKEAAVNLPAAVPAVTIHWILSIIEQGFVIMGVAEDGAIAGSLAMKPAWFPWAPGVKFVENAWWYVAPPYRKGGLGIHLVEQCIAYANANKFPFMLSILSGLNTDTKDRLCRKLGLTYVGGVFMYNFGAKADV